MNSRLLVLLITISPLLPMLCPFSLCHYPNLVIFCFAYHTLKSKQKMLDLYVHNVACFCRCTNTFLCVAFLCVGSAAHGREEGIMKSQACLFQMAFINAEQCHAKSSVVSSNTPLLPCTCTHASKIDMSALGHTGRDRNSAFLCGGKLDCHGVAVFGRRKPHRLHQKG